MVKIENKYANFLNAVKRLNEANTAYKSNLSNEFYQDALIKRFELAFELAWKTIRIYFAEEGYKLMTGSPKAVLAGAFQEGIIQNEQIWLDMLADRNDATHDYDNELAKKVAEKISSRYAKELTKLTKIIG